MKNYTKIPLSRVAVLIGKKGETKQVIEKMTETKIKIDSSEGTVEVEDTGNPISAIDAMNIVNAIGRGFSPEKALILLDDENILLEIIKLSRWVSDNHLERVRGRIIGKNGKTRYSMETATGGKVSVSGRTVALLGTPEQIDVLRRAISMIIDGSPHNSVYSFLSKEKERLRLGMG